ncbi:Ribonuclease Y [Rosistilla oblonga]|uniref:ribonuclease Y n=1 Tax=Rosistilla oblonga TaxID=2527990 RepID=UPI00118D02B5|nr:ribonuclease Y [Rosistilla oblonga]QDV12213.1 Ribonuclease Y [Rosistilla oblonga]
MNALDNILGLQLHLLATVDKDSASEFGLWLVSTSTLILLALAGALFGFCSNWLYQRTLDKRGIRQAKLDSEAMIEKAKLETESIHKNAALEAKEIVIRHKAEADEEISRVKESLRETRHELESRAATLAQSEEGLKKQERGLENTQRRLAQQLEAVNRKRERLDQLTDEKQKILQQASGMSKEEASKQLMQTLQMELDQEIGTAILHHERHLSESLDAKAREMLLTAMQRYAAVHTAENTTSTVDIPNDDMKGRIIGREGRNIRAFEKATGIDVIIDDSPGVVIVSGFDPVRRELARQSLDKLISDGRIHPSRIEEVVAQTSKDLDEFIRRKGEEAADEVNVPGLNKRIIEMLGRLHFRTSYSQNVLRHSIEVAYFSSMIAEMIGLDPDVARRCGLLHDIGKAADHELEGGHPKIGADLLKRHNESPEVVHAAFGHHDEIITEFPYTVLVATADACSASRPGARRESLERYVKRMEELESIATDFDGVEQAFAIQAGRELRVIANSKITDDAKAAAICRNIAKAFEQQLTYPGEIKVTVVRESRFTELAR